MIGNDRNGLRSVSGHDAMAIILMVMIITAGICIMGIASTDADGSANPGLRGGNFEYQVSEEDMTATITKYNGQSTSLDIPSKLWRDGQEYSITAIGPHSFDGCSSLVFLTFSDSITLIDEYAFYECSNLRGISISKNITAINANAFHKCTSLEAITLPDGVTAIADNTFRDCWGLTTLKMPDGIKTIGMDAFHTCINLTSVDIPDSVESIGSGSFESCSGLTSVKIPDGVNMIGSYAFRRCTGLTSVDIPDSVTSIGDHAFQQCSGLASATIPNGITAIEPFLFQECSELISLTLGAGVTSIGTEAFSGCYKLETISIAGDGPIDSQSSAYRMCNRSLEFVSGRLGHSMSMYSDQECTVALPMSTILSTDCRIYVKWDVEQYTITFDTEGGTHVGPIIQEYGGDVIAPAPPTRTGYTFIGWSPAIPTTMPAEDVICVAQWELTRYVVTFDPNGGTVNPTTIDVTYGSKYGNLPTPTREGYVFMGWFTATDNGLLVDSDTVAYMVGDQTLYALWSSVQNDSTGMSIKTISWGLVATILVILAGIIVFMRRNS